MNSSWTTAIADTPGTPASWRESASAAAATLVLSAYLASTNASCPVNTLLRSTSSPRAEMRRNDFTSVPAAASRTSAVDSSPTTRMARKRVRARPADAFWPPSLSSRCTFGDDARRAGTTPNASTEAAVVASAKNSTRASTRKSIQ